MFLSENVELILLICLLECGIVVSIVEKSTVLMLLHEERDIEFMYINRFEE